MSKDPASPRPTGDSSENDSRYRALFENPVIGIRISSVADGGRIVEANPAYQKMLGYPEAELSDLVMPGGNGADLALKLGSRYPELRVVLMSGYTDDALASREADLTRADAFLEKPFATQDLLRLIRDLL